MVNELNITRKLFFFNTQAENGTGRLIPDLCFFFKKKALYDVKAIAPQLSFNIFG